MYYDSYNISHAHDVTSLLRMLKYHTCDLSFRGLWLLLCSCSVLAVSLDVYPRLLLCPCSVLAVFLLCFSCVLRDLWPSVSSTSDCVFKPDAKRRRLSLSRKKKVGVAAKGAFTRDREGKTDTSPSTPNAKTEQGHSCGHNRVINRLSTTMNNRTLF